MAGRVGLDSQSRPRNLTVSHTARQCLKINPVGALKMTPLRIVPPSPGALPNEDIAFGIASWSKPDRAPEYSVKYRWRDRNGRICRGGEFPSPLDCSRCDPRLAIWPPSTHPPRPPPTPPVRLPSMTPRS